MNVNRDITGVSLHRIVFKDSHSRGGELNSQRNQALVGILIVAIKPNYVGNMRCNEPPGANRNQFGY